MRVYIIKRKILMSEVHKIFLDKQDALDYIKPLWWLYDLYIDLMKNNSLYDFQRLLYLFRCILYEVTKYDDDYKYPNENHHFFPRYELIEKEVE